MVWGAGRMRWALGLVLLAASLLAAVPVRSAAASPVRSQIDLSEGLRVEGRTTYTVDLDASVVRVEYEATLTNQIPDRVTGAYIESFYFPAFAVPVLAGATDLSASRGDGRALSVRLEPSGDGIVASAEIDLSPDLQYGQTQTIRLGYDLPGRPPRTVGAAQVNPAFATFPVFPVADPGLGAVDVVVSDRLQVEIVGSETDVTVGDGVRHYTAEAIADPVEWLATVIVRNDSALVERTVAYGGNEIRIQGWPDDPEWVDFTAGLAERGLPALEAAIGFSWGEDRRLDIVETSTPYVYGYGGWYEHSSSLIEVGEALDAHVTLHEMAHVWFNEQLFRGRWLNEAFADEFAAVAMEAVGQERPIPDPVVDGAAGQLPLNDWTAPALGDESARDQEIYGYGASWWLAHQLTMEIGVEGLSAVVEAADERHSPYPSSAGTDRLARVADWRTLLDLLEEVGGSAQAEGLFRDLVVNPGQAALLDERAEARAGYVALVEAGDGWAPPAEVREAMADWRFDEVAALLLVADDLLGVRDGVSDRLDGIDLDLPVPLQEQFESTEDVGELVELMEDVDAAAEALVGVVEEREGAGLLERVGLLFTDVDDDIEHSRDALAAGQYEQAGRVADDAGDQLADAARDGALRLGGAALAVLLVGLGLVLVVRHRRGSRRAGEDEPPLDVVV